VQIEVVEDGVEKVMETLRGKKIALLAVGCNSMISAKEEIDRTDLRLPPDQQRLVDRVIESGIPAVMVLFANYPYAVREAKAHVPAILMSATGAQDMGLAMAETLFGKNAPAGRLNMTWYNDVSQLPSIDDYDIIKGKRTYRYFDGDVLYPFGHGLTYSRFAYGDLQVKHSAGRLKVRFTVTNAGDTLSDEVAQVYAIAPASRVKKPLRQLIGFERVKNVAPGECRPVDLDIPVEELRFYDVISQSLMVEEGDYTVFVGPSSGVEAAKTTVRVPGRKPGLRNLRERVLADHYDDYENISLEEGNFGLTAVAVHPDAAEGWISYRDCDLAGECSVLSLHMKSEIGCKVDVYVDGGLAGSWQGDTRTCEHRSAPMMDRLGWQQVEQRNRHRKPIYEDIEIDLAGCELRPGSEIRLHISGDIRLCYMKMLEGKAVGKINLGVAN
jgi:beta-glucosidase